MKSGSISRNPRLINSTRLESPSLFQTLSVRIRICTERTFVDQSADFDEIRARQVAKTLLSLRASGWILLRSANFGIPRVPFLGKDNITGCYIDTLGESFHFSRKGFEFVAGSCLVI